MSYSSHLVVLECIRQTSRSFSIDLIARQIQFRKGLNHETKTMTCYHIEMSLSRDCFSVHLPGISLLQHRCHRLPDSHRSVSKEWEERRRAGWADCSSHLIDLERLRQVFRSFIPYAVASKIEIGECLNRMVEIVTRYKSRPFISLDSLWEHRPEISLLQCPSRCSIDSDGSVPEQSGRDDGGASQLIVFLTWLVLSASARCPAPSAFI